MLICALKPVRTSAMKKRKKGWGINVNLKEKAESLICYVDCVSYFDVIDY